MNASVKTKNVCEFYVKRKTSIQNICEFYALAHKLKNILRTGWKLWKVDAERFESVAEHVYGAQMLAIGIVSEFDLKLDLPKVIMMLAIHDLAEVIVGDIPATGSPVTPEQKHKMELDAIIKILAPLANGDKILKLWKEYEEKKTPEAKFTALVDKFEGTMQCKFYDEAGQCNFDRVCTPAVEAKKNIGRARGINSMSELWFTQDSEKFGYDKDFDGLFAQIAEFAKKKKIFTPQCKGGVIPPL